MRDKIKEGELYRTLTVAGRDFPIYYGYYEERDRYGKYGEPLPIFPNFLASPQYTADGVPYATEMQDICEHYDGLDCGDCCADCRQYERGEDLIGLCRSAARKKTTDLLKENTL